jgi:uncharacterized membrane protein YgcG
LASLESYLVIEFPEITQLLVVLSAMPKEISDSMLFNSLPAVSVAINIALYTILVASCKDKPRIQARIAMQSVKGRGCEALRRVQQVYSPSSNAQSFELFNDVLNPKASKTVAELSESLPRWIELQSQQQLSAGIRLPDQLLRSAVYKTLPTELRHHINLQGDKFASFDELIQYLEAYIRETKNEKVQGGSQMDVSTFTADEIQWDDQLQLYVFQQRKGKGGGGKKGGKTKGSGKTGGGGKGAGKGVGKTSQPTGAPQQKGYQQQQQKGHGQPNQNHQQQPFRPPYNPQAPSHQSHPFRPPWQPTNSKGKGKGGGGGGG